MASKNNSPLEAWEQEQFFKWVYANQIRYPELELCNGSMNGVRISPGLRKKLKGQGLRPGFPDIDLPVKRGEFSGLKIELKRRKGGQISTEQNYIIPLLRSQGYKVEVCKGWNEAVSIVKSYLALSRLDD